MSAESPSEPTGRPTRSWGSLAVALVVFVATIAAAHRFVFDLGLMGWDTLPIADASRIASFGDLTGTVTEELMDGRYMDGHFYRPVKNAVFAVDWALWGLNPTGWHLTDLAILLPRPADAETLWHLGDQIAGALGQDVDLVDLRQASTVMRHQVITQGTRLWQRDQAADEFELSCLSEYWDLQIMRRGILSDIRQRGSVYDR